MLRPDAAFRLCRYSTRNPGSNQSQPERREQTMTRPGRGQFAPDYFNLVRRPFAEQPLFERLRPGGQVPGCRLASDFSGGPT